VYFANRIRKRRGLARKTQTNESRKSRETCDNPFPFYDVQPICTCHVSEHPSDCYCRNITVVIHVVVVVVSNTDSLTWRRRSSVGGGGGGDGSAGDAERTSSSATMKLVSRLRGVDNRDGQQQPPPPPSTLPGGRRLSVAAAPPRAASAAGVMAARDRSRSLCVERLGLATLLHPAAIPVRELNRRRASSAL